MGPIFTVRQHSFPSPFLTLPDKELEFGFLLYVYPSFPFHSLFSLAMIIYKNTGIARGNRKPPPTNGGQLTISLCQQNCRESKFGRSPCWLGGGVGLSCLAISVSSNVRAVGDYLPTLGLRGRHALAHCRHYTLEGRSLHHNLF